MQIDQANFIMSLVDSEQAATYEIECEVEKRLSVDVSESEGKVMYDGATYSVTFIGDQRGVFRYVVTDNAKNVEYEAKLIVFGSIYNGAWVSASP